MTSAVLLLVALLVAVFQSTTAQTCAGAGYDVSSAAVDMSVVSGSYTWYLHPCGSISTTTNALCANTTIHPYGSSMCQVPTGSTTTSYNIAIYNTSVAATGVTWMAISNGVQYSVQDGDFCGIGAPRETTVQFICNATATTPWFKSVTEVETCWYTAVVHTSSACTATGVTAGNQVGSTFYSNQCGAGLYDLSSLNQDFYYVLGNYRYWVHPCGTVTNSSCSGAQPTSFCQLASVATALPVDASHWNASEPQIWTVTPNGLSVNIRDGAVCGAIGAGVPRQTSIFFLCNPLLTAPILSFVAETETCHYKAVFQTPAVCSATNQPTMGYCGGAGYDLTAIQNYNIYWNGMTSTGGGWQWYVSPCGQIAPSTTNACAGKQSMLCQINPAATAWNNAASWNASVAQSGVTWVALANGNGVQYSVQDGDFCGIGAPRETTVQFICDPNANQPFVSAINETETCWYTVVIHTTYACHPVGPRFSHNVGSSYYDYVCGGEVYDFSNILAQGDLVLDSNTSSPTLGFRYYVDLCGRVQQPNCSSVQPSMICQVQKSGAFTAYSLGFVDSTTPVLYTINSNGLSMSFQDGTPCGGIPNRQTTLQIICDGTSPAQLTSVRETETCHYAATIRAQCNAGNTPTLPGSSSSSTGGAVSVSSSPRVIPPVTACGGAGYNVLTVAQQDLTLVSNGITWTLRPCGTVASVCNDAGHPYGAMLCQQSNGYSWTASVYNSTTALSATWLAMSNGVQMSIQDGDFCGVGAARETTVQFVCDPTRTTPFLESVTEIEVCWYTAVVRTSSACATTGPTASNQVGSSFYSRMCGGGLVAADTFASTLNRDFYYQTVQGFHYWVHPCGTISNSSCGGAQPTSFCQLGTYAGATPVDVSHWNSSEPQIWTVTSTGAIVNIRDGAACGAVGSNVPRQASIEFVCNPTASTPIISYVSETEVCHYRAVIQTSAVCTGSNAPVNGYCGGAGYDLSALQGMNIYYNALSATGWQWYLAPCGSIAPTTTNACAGKQSMLCQINPAGTAWNNAASWNTSIAQSSVSWVALASGNGVQYSVQDGDFCGIGAPRETTVQFICNRTATSPWIASITEPETCWYTAVVHTIYACQTVATPTKSVGYSFYSNECGGGIIDFTNIRNQGDLYLDTNTSSPTQGYKWYLDLCGQVQEKNCSSVQPTGFCQVQKSGAYTSYSIANINSTTPVLHTITSNGLTLQIQDGTPCGGIPNRQASIQIICDGTTPAQLTSVRETETCHYAATIRAQCNYIGGSGGSTGGVTPGGDNSSSSSLSGGAIAGIVIGCVVGVAILLAVMAVVCCGSMARGKKSNDEGYSGSGKYSNQTEESHVEQSSHQGEVELEETA